ncbi:MAG TPA: hypothetical protein VNS46_21290 [Nocardioides sp.]|nr:hypothetical protein [Nocardioides sp.]
MTHPNQAQRPTSVAPDRAANRAADLGALLLVLERASAVDGRDAQALLRSLADQARRARRETLEATSEALGSGGDEAARLVEGATRQAALIRRSGMAVLDRRLQDGERFTTQVRATVGSELRAVALAGSGPAAGRGDGR